MDCRVVSKIHINKNEWRKVGEFLYNAKTDALYYEGPYFFPVQLLIEQGLSKAYVTPGFLKLPFILRGWINLDMLLREIDLLKLTLQGKLLLHASCVNDSLIVGFPQSGKTYQTYKWVAAGGTLISEEYTVIENQIATPYKKMSRSCFSLKTLRACKMPLSLKEWIWLGFTTLRAKLMPFMFEAVIWKKILVSGKAAQVRHIFYGSTGLEVTDYKQLIILTENEFPFMSDYFLEAYALCSGIDLVAIQNKQRQLIKEFFDAVCINSEPQ